MHLYSASHQMIILSCLSLLLCTFTSGVTSHDRKHSMCCTNHMSKLPINLKNGKIQIKSCDILQATDGCLAAITFTDQFNNMYCFRPNATQLRRKIEEKGVICEDETKS